MTTETAFDRLRTLVNANLGVTLTRHTLMTTCIGSVSNERVRESTLDTYRRMITELGYLESMGRGKYLVKNRIPEEVLVSEIEESYLKSLKHKRDVSNNPAR
jgi:hypothetical protein